MIGVSFFAGFVYDVLPVYNHRIMVPAIASISFIAFYKLSEHIDSMERQGICRIPTMIVYGLHPLIGLVVGKILGDTVDTVIGCSNILKNAVGIVGIIVIIAICIGPIIKLTILTLSYHLVAAISQPIADAKIVKLLDEMGETFKLLLGIMSAIAVMLIIGTTLVIKISNSGMMYR